MEERLKRKRTYERFLSGNSSTSYIPIVNTEYLNQLDWNQLNPAERLSLIKYALDQRINFDVSNVIDLFRSKTSLVSYTARDVFELYLSLSNYIAPPTSPILVAVETILTLMLESLLERDLSNVALLLAYAFSTFPDSDIRYLRFVKLISLVVAEHCTLDQENAYKFLSRYTPTFERQRPGESINALLASVNSLTKMLLDNCSESQIVNRQCEFIFNTITDKIKDYAAQRGYAVEERQPDGAIIVAMPSAAPLNFCDEAKKFIDDTLSVWLNWTHTAASILESSDRVQAINVLRENSTLRKYLFELYTNKAIDQLTAVRNKQSLRYLLSQWRCS